MKTHAPHHSPLPCDPLGCASAKVARREPAAPRRTSSPMLKWLDNPVLREFAHRETGN